MAALTTVAAGVGVATQVGGAIMSFTQANRERKLQEEAAADAKKAMTEAKRTLDVNYAKGLGVSMEAYDLAREASGVTAAQAIEAARESERGVSSVAGRVQMAQNEMNQQIAAQMGQEMSSIERAQAEEARRIAEAKANIDLAEATGAQAAAADARMAENQAMQRGFEAVGGAISTGLEAMELYPKNKQLKLAGDIVNKAVYDKNRFKTIGDYLASLNIAGVDSKAVAGLDRDAAFTYLKNMDETGFQSVYSSLFPKKK